VIAYDHCAGPTAHQNIEHHVIAARQNRMINQSDTEQIEKRIMMAHVYKDCEFLRLIFWQQTK
jgi:hypothetical protein